MLYVFIQNDQLQEILHCAQQERPEYVFTASIISVLAIVLPTGGTIRSPECLKLLVSVQSVFTKIFYTVLKIKLDAS